MNISKISIILAAIAVFGMAATSCVGPESGYAEARTDVRGSIAPGSYSNYSVTLGDGYAGRGYYYGPPNTGYYSRQPGVTYYRTRESVPQQYWSQSTTYGSDSQPGTSYRREVRTTTTTGPSTTVPTSSYILSQGDGYAGRGYYYGPPNVRYYDESPGVMYYRDRQSVPTQYRTQTSVSIGN